jgi:N-acetylglucosamine malate deacetylase 2
MTNLRSVVAFFAHPDDETLFAGGIIALLTSQRVPVHIVCATRGEGGDMGNPPVVPRRDMLGAAREQELRRAASALGATVTVLDYVDPTIGPDDMLFPFAADFDTLAGQYHDIARQRRADLVLTHGSDGEYGHPAHQLVHRAVMRGVSAVPNTLIYTISAKVPTIEDRLWNQNEPAHLALDIRPWLDAKLAATECHVSQYAVFRKFRDAPSLRDTLGMVESVRRHWPETHGELPDDAFARLLKTAGAWVPK